MRLPKFRLFDYTTPGPGVEKDAPPKKGIALFFDIFWRRFWKLVSINAIFFAFSIPALILSWILTYALSTFALSTLPEFEINDSLAVGITLISVFASCFFTSMFGTGAPTAAMTYVIRNYREDTHAWVWADFWQTFKEKFLKATGVYIIDTVFVCLLTVNFCVYGSLAAGYANSLSVEYIGFSLLQGLMVVIFLVLLLMHCYVYPILITTDDSLFRIYRNSFILALGKLPQTLLSTLICTLFTGAVIVLSCMFPIFGLVFVPVIMFAFNCYINLFVTYPIVKKYRLSSKERDL